MNSFLISLFKTFYGKCFTKQTKKIVSSENQMNVEGKKLLNNVHRMNNWGERKKKMILTMKNYPSLESTDQNEWIKNIVKKNKNVNEQLYKWSKHNIYLGFIRFFLLYCWVPEFELSFLSIYVWALDECIYLNTINIE